MIPQTYEHPLGRDEVINLMDRIMTGQCTPDQIRDFLGALARRGETAQEIAAAVFALRRHAVQIPLKTSIHCADTCGTVAADRPGADGAVEHCFESCAFGRGDQLDANRPLGASRPRNARAKNHIGDLLCLVDRFQHSGAEEIAGDLDE